MKRFLIILKWTAIYSVVFLLWTFVQKSFGALDKDVANYGKYSFIFMLPALIMYYFAIREINNKCYQGNISFWQALSSGILLTLFNVILSIPIVYITCTYISPDFLDTLRVYAVKSGDIAADKAEKFYTLPVFMVSNSVYGMFLGLVTSLLVSAYLRFEIQKEK